MRCYACNKLFSEQEMLRWQPFGLCDECQERADFWQQNERRIALNIRNFWYLPVERQRILSAAYGGTQEVKA